MSQNQSITIGGLPVAAFEGRRIKAKMRDNIFTTVICRGTFKKSILVDAVVDGRLRQHHVTADRVRPNWGENEDLHQQAVAEGLLYNGEANFGRALQLAEQELAAAEPPAAFVPDMQQLSTTLELAASPDLPEVEEPAPPEPEVEGPAKDYAAISGVSASITADPSWTQDFSELQLLLAARGPRNFRRAALRIELEALDLAEQEDGELLPLYAQTLLDKGVVLHWDAPPGWGQPAAAASQPVAPFAKFTAAVDRWLARRPATFTYEKLFDELQLKDLGYRRAVARERALAQGYVMCREGDGQGRPSVFHLQPSPR